jgi:hypothetical protein
LKPDRFEEEALPRNVGYRRRRSQKQIFRFPPNARHPVDRLGWACSLLRDERMAEAGKRVERSE